VFSERNAVLVDMSHVLQIALAAGVHCD